MIYDKFTPGPLVVPNNGNLNGSVVAKDGEMVCAPSGAGRHEDEAEANARLIADAHEMYEFLALLDNYYAVRGESNSVTKTISQVLKKARGEV